VHAGFNETIGGLCQLKMTNGNKKTTLEVEKKLGSKNTMLSSRS
jgi:hypothetical protein